jgi:hypothetical protein
MQLMVPDMPLTAAAVAAAAVGGGGGGLLARTNHFPTIHAYLNVQKATQELALRHRLPFKCHLELVTNVSTHSIPLTINDGSLSLSYLRNILVESELGMQMPWGGIAESSSNNSDIRFITVGDVSTTRPKPFRFALANFNYIPVTYSLSYMQQDMCICKEASWRVEESDTGPPSPLHPGGSSSSQSSHSYSHDEFHRNTITKLMNTQHTQHCSCLEDSASEARSQAALVDMDVVPGMAHIFEVFFKPPIDGRGEGDGDGAAAVSMWGRDDFSEDVSATTVSQFVVTSAHTRVEVVASMNFKSGDIRELEGAAAGATAAAAGTDADAGAGVGAGADARGLVLSSPPSIATTAHPVKEFMFGTADVATVLVQSTFEHDPHFTAVYTGSKMLQIIEQEGPKGLSQLGITPAPVVGEQVYRTVIQPLGLCAGVMETGQNSLWLCMSHFFKQMLQVRTKELKERKARSEATKDAQEDGGASSAGTGTGAGAGNREGLPTIEETKALSDTLDVINQMNIDFIMPENTAVQKVSIQALMEAFLRFRVHWSRVFPAGYPMGTSTLGIDTTSSRISLPLAPMTIQSPLEVKHRTKSKS